VKDILTFNVVLPTPPTEPNDITIGQLTIQIGETDPQVIMVAKDQVEIVGLQGEQDSIISLSFVYIDDSGNVSDEPSTLVGTLVDTFAPPAPGVLGLVVTGETTPVEPVPPSEPVPPADPTPSQPIPPEEPIV